MTQTDTLAGGVRPRPLESKDTRELLDLMRELEAAVAVCHWAIKSYNTNEHRAAVKMVKSDVRRCCK